MLYLDGESGSKGVQVGNHTKHCWFCRLRLGKMERAISEFMEVRNASFADTPTLPRRASVNFEGKLAKLEIESGGPKFLSVLVQESGLFGLHLAPRAAIFLVLLGVLAVGLLRISLTTPVSANELLARVQAAQSAEFDRVAAPVLHQKLHVQRTVAGTTVEAATDYDSWDDHFHGRYRQTGSSEQILAELRTICNANRLDWQAPLSAVGYARWRNSLAAKQDIVMPAKMPAGESANGSSAPITLTTIAKTEAGGKHHGDGSAAEHITKAELVVRATDWHPLRERLWVDDREYEIAELDYKVLPLWEVDASIFEPPHVPVIHVVPPRPIMIDTTADLVVPTPDPEDTEMSVRYGLHELDADLGQPIEITRDGQGTVIVDASAVAPDLQAKLQEEIGWLPNTGLKLGSNSRPACMVCLAPSPHAPANAPMQSLTFAPPANPNERRLEGILGGQNARESFTREVLANTGDALSHAFALRNLAVRYPAEEEAKLAPATRQQLLQMVVDHIAVLIERTNTLKGFLWPLLEALSSSQLSAPSPRATEGAWSGHAGESAGTALQSPGSGPAWQDASRRFLVETQQVDRLIEGLLSRTNNPTPAAQVVPELRQALSQEQQDLNQYEAETGLGKTEDK